ncbi:MAG: efflux RND transporter periplasmic adaptor subunit [Hydrogenophaga sp.]|nr:efflux RND transporter periplasmic adaptor subunit [Hydrogenophaga sp.]MDZ4238426.1 efflux RND transporter periplasmic adaptor subunit [Hydrogenophaga sp.]
MTQPSLHPYSTCQTAAWSALTLSLVLGLSSAWAQTSTAPIATPPAAASPARALVGVARLDSVWVQPEREAPASVVARNVSRLSAETAGTLLRWTADVGATVKRGDVLAQIDPRDAELGVQRAQAALDASNARLKLAQAQLQRSKELVAQGFFSQEALAQRETEVALVHTEASANRAQLATAQRQLGKTTLRAPFDGSVTERLAQAGEAVAPGSVLYVMADSGPAELATSLSPADVAGLRATQAARFETPGASHAVRLLRVAPTVTAPARTQAARLAFADATTAPAAGTSGTLRWQEAAPHLPPGLMVRRQNVLGVFVQQGSGAQATARFVPLPGAQEGRATAVALPAETPVIVRGQAALQPGQAIDAQAVGQ